MNHYISEDKRNVLKQMIRRIEEELGVFSAKIEDNESISDSDWKQYEAVIDNMYIMLSQLDDEI